MCTNLNHVCVSRNMLFLKNNTQCRNKNYVNEPHSYITNLINIDIKIFPICTDVLYLLFLNIFWQICNMRRRIRSFD